MKTENNDSVQDQNITGDNTVLPVVKYYDVVNVKLTHPLFSWVNGFYAVIEKTETELRLCQIDENGNPQLFDDGKFMIGCTGVKNPEVIPTSLKLLF